MVRRFTMVAGATPESGLERMIDRTERRLKAMQARHVPRAVVAAWAEAVEDAYQERLTELTLFADPDRPDRPRRS